MRISTWHITVSNWAHTVFLYLLLNILTQHNSFSLSHHCHVCLTVSVCLDCQSFRLDFQRVSYYSFVPFRGKICYFKRLYLVLRTLLNPLQFCYQTLMVQINYKLDTWYIIVAKMKKSSKNTLAVWVLPAAPIDSTATMTAQLLFGGGPTRGLCSLFSRCRSCSKDQYLGPANLYLSPSRTLPSH